MSPFGSFLVSTKRYPGISFLGCEPSSLGARIFPLVSTNEVFGRTVGMYLAVIGVPFLSTRLTVTPVARPTNSGSGVKVTFPASSIVYVPSPGTFFSVVPSSKVGLTVSSISTGISLPLIVTFPPSNVGVPD